MAQNRKILHVDDDFLITNLVADHLNRKGYEVTSLNDPTAAIQTVIDGNFRVVILDIEMPGIGGLQLLEEIKAHDGGIQVVMLTGLVKTSTVLRTMRRGALTCNFKPMGDFHNLDESVELAFQIINRWWESLNELVATERKNKALVQ